MYWPSTEERIPNGIVNIVTGNMVVNPSVYVQDSVRLCKEQMEEFENSWPEGFHDRISQRVVNVSISHKHITVADTIVYDIEMIHVKASSLYSNLWHYDTKKLIAHEFRP